MVPEALLPHVALQGRKVDPPLALALKALEEALKDLQEGLGWCPVGVASMRPPPQQPLCSTLRGLTSSSTYSSTT